MAIRLLDNIIFFTLSLIGVLFCIILKMVNLISRKKFNPKYSEKKLLQFIHSFMEAIIDYGLSIDSDLNNYFTKVYTIFIPNTVYENKKLNFNSTHTIAQYCQHPNTYLKKIGLNKCNFLINQCLMLKYSYHIIINENITLIRAQDPHFSGVFAYLLSWLTQRPYIIHLLQNYDLAYTLINGLSFPPFKFRIIEKTIESFILKRAAYVSSSCENHKNYAISRGVSPTKVFVIRTNIAPIHFLPPHERKNIKTQLNLDNKQIILYVGRLHAIKYPYDILKAFSLVTQKHPLAHLVIIGSGPLAEDLKNLSKQLEINNRFFFLGNKSQDELIHFYSSADIIIFGHAGGVSLVEASLSETPIIAYSHDLAPEIIGHNDRGLLADFRDIEHLASHIDFLLTNMDIGKEIGKKARNYILAHYDKKTIIELELRMHQKFITQ
ncbi:MAG: hypothetical protein A3G92_07465 [Deltaproteobacteria bacterium RIFCSPLOWO2_12_FULL_38_8]|nr:MAG: hypothetical protein A3G92_07465 [Deltaproteobacteria bacterium RIFCSPLOWO2_12_FULL_38_8]